MSRGPSRAYVPQLSTCSLPEVPTQPSTNNINEWRALTASREEEGLRLLIDHYRPSISLLGSPIEQMRDLALALARDHVPFFSSKRPKTSKWNIHEHAKFLLDVQGELKKHKDLGAAVRNAGGRLPKHLYTPSEKSLKRRYYLAQDDLSKLVSVNLDGVLKPLGKTEASLFKSFLEDDYYDLGTVRFESCPDDPDAVVVSGLSVEELPTQALDPRAREI